MQTSTPKLSSGFGLEQRRIAIYLRSATGDPASLQRQLQNCDNYCSLTFGSDSEFVFRDPGKSGNSLKRDGLHESISAIRSGQVTDVIVEHVDRLARGIAQVVYLMQLCESQKVTIHETARGSPVTTFSLIQTEAQRHRSTMLGRTKQIQTQGRRFSRPGLCDA